MHLQGGIYIDDAGTPGVVSPSFFLHKNRKSWAAVIVPDQAAGDLKMALDMFLEGMATDYGVNELHFNEIYSGRKRSPFEDVCTDDRFELINLVTDIFEKFQLPIFFQTTSPEFLSELRPKIQLPKVGFFDLDKHDHFGLVFLLFQVRGFIHKYHGHFPNPLPVIIDEDLVKAGVSVDMGRWEDTFQCGKVEFQRSHEEPFLQLADFAASAIARCQWLLGRGNLNPRDTQFMEIVSSERLYIINLPSVATSRVGHTTQDYDDYLRQNRRSKGLPDEPPSASEA
jgi:hypothetical protein